MVMVCVSGRLSINASITMEDSTFSVSTWMVSSQPNTPMKISAMINLSIFIFLEFEVVGDTWESEPNDRELTILGKNYFSKICITLTDEVGESILPAIYIIDAKD